MGGQQSVPIANGNGNSSNGARNHDEEEDNHASTTKCQPCFFFSPAGAGGNLKNLLVTGINNNDKSNHRSSSDPMGSPLPDTPVFERKRRQATKERLRDDPIFSSKYGGLEKEVSDSRLNSTGNNSNNSNNLFLKPYGAGAIRAAAAAKPAQEQQDGATVYEGPDAEAKLLETYDLLEVLGVGSTSTVHRCVKKKKTKSSSLDGEQQQEEQFACKVIDCQLIEERFQGMMAQFQTEIEALRKLQHPGIIRLYDVFIKTDDKIFIIMELMEGGELFDYVVQKGTLTEDEAALIVKKVTSALVYMHSRNVCHRDLKPENLLLKTKPKGPHDAVEVKVIDFGLSKAMEEPVARTFLGTRGYLAPEMLRR